MNSNKENHEQLEEPRHQLLLHSSASPFCAIGVSCCDAFLSNKLLLITIDSIGKEPPVIDQHPVNQ